MNKPSDLKGLVLDPVTNDQRYIGNSEPRHSARRLLEGQGTYIDDIQLPRMGHVVYWRSPVAHMKIGKIHSEKASKMPGVLAVVDGIQMAKICKPWVATLGHLGGMKSAPQHALAIERACWQGEPVVAVVAETRAQAEDALQHIEVEWEELPAVVSMETALDANTPLIHPELGDNLCFTRSLDVGNVHVICKDVGGSFGIKVHAYPDDFATVGLAMMLERPVKFVADRLESFTSDIHAREHRIKGRIAANKEGDILAFEIDDLTAIGPYSMFPRTSAIEGNQVVNLVGGPYKHKHYRAHLDVVFQNKTPTCQYRGVGHPIACAVTEGLVDLAAQKLQMDPLEFRKRNVIPDDAYPCSGISGIKLEVLSHEQCLRTIEKMMNYSALRKEQAELRKKGIYRGIGFATLIELTNPSPAFYGVGGARIASQDGATVRLDPSGVVSVLVGVGEQGQGTEGIYAQIAADAVGVSINQVRIVTGDTDVTPYGGGTWASRGAGVGGEAVLLACQALQENILKLAGAILNRPVAELSIHRSHVLDKASGEQLLPFSEIGRIGYFRTDTLPAGFSADLMVTRHYTQKEYPFIFTNGVQASYVEVDPDTGFVKLLKHWAVEDCGRVINPMLVDEQVRGAIVQGIGGVLFEECLYDESGILRNGNMADYLVPMANEMPDIEVAHVETPTQSSKLGAKGAGEAGTAGAPGAVQNAINDALAPFNVTVFDQPITCEKILRALKKI